MVTGFARLEGRAIGIVANQPRHRGGVIDVEASQKAARFVSTCADFGLPLVVLVDTPGFVPGSKQESAGIIRHGATLLRAFAAARVPRVTVVLRQAFGGGYITMNSKDLGADFSFAWPRAKIGVIGARQAVGLTRRSEIEAAPDPAGAREALAAEYAERQAAAVVAREGVIDEVVTPSETRRRLAGALSMMAGKRRGRD
jgi:acetyl-CoA carboxylase carboxyltransferase component